MPLAPASHPIACYRALLLGPFGLERDGVPLDAGRWPPRVRSLFTFLVTAPGRRRRRDDILEILFPDAAPESGAANLRMVAHRLRAALGGGTPSPVLVEHGWVTLHPSHRWELDLEEFLDVSDAAGDDLSALERAAPLYRGEPLAAERYEDWTAPIRQQAQRRWRKVCLRLAHIHRARSSCDQAAYWLERALESDPLDEEALRALLGILGELGRRSEALRRYRRFERRLADDLGVPPEQETRNLVAHFEKELRLAIVRLQHKRHIIQACIRQAGYHL